MTQPRELDIVALTEDRATTHFETGEPIILRKGQVGTVVMEYDDRAVDVAFSDRDGTTDALETLTCDLLVLHEALLDAAV